MSDADEAGSSDAGELRWLKAAFVVNIVVFAVAILLIQLDPLQQQANRGYFDSPVDELGPDPHPFLPISTLDEAVKIANGILPGITGGAFIPFDRDYEEFFGELRWDHDMGNIYYWEMSQDNLSIAIDATTGEVVDFSWYRDQENGTLTNERALVVGMGYIKLFGELPDDSSTPSAEYISQETRMTWDDETGEFIEVKVYHWDIQIDRVKDGIPTDDYIRVIMDPNGHLRYYYKTWNMRLGGVTASHEVSYEEALGIARSAAEGANITSIEHRIVRPNGAWRDAPWRSGTDPVAVWRVTFEYDEVYYLHYLDIDDRTGEIVGWDGYF